MKIRKIVFIIILMTFLFLTNGCLNNNKKEIIEENSCNNCGTIIFQFSKDQIEKKSILFTPTSLFNFIEVKITMNDEIEFNKIVRNNSVFRIKVPEGKVEVTHSIFSESIDQVYFYTGLKDHKKCFHNDISEIREKKLNFEVKSNQNIYLKIIKVGKIRQRCALTTAGFIASESSMGFQDIAFEVEKIEESGMEKINNSKSR